MQHEEQRDCVSPKKMGRLSGNPSSQRYEFRRGVENLRDRPTTYEMGTPTCMYVMRIHTIMTLFQVSQKYTTHDYIFLKNDRELKYFFSMTLSPLKRRRMGLGPQNHSQVAHCHVDDSGIRVGFLANTVRKKVSPIRTRIHLSTGFERVVKKNHRCFGVNVIDGSSRFQICMDPMNTLNFIRHLLLSMLF